MSIRCQKNGHATATVYTIYCNHLKITVKTSAFDYEVLREKPGMRPAPYLASRGFTWIQRYDYSELSDDKLQCYIAECRRIVVSGFSRRKHSELRL